VFTQTCIKQSFDPEVCGLFKKDDGL